MKRTVKYGLTAPLRTFDEPEQWTGNETITVRGASVLSDIIAPDGRVLCLTTQPNSTEPISITRVTSGNCRTRIALVLAQGTNTSVRETITGAGSLRSQTELSVTSGCHVAYTIVQDMAPDSLALLHYEATIAHAELRWLFVGLGASTTQAFIGTNAAERSVVSNNAVLFGVGTQQFDLHVGTNHVGAHSKSDMLTRSVLDGRARAIYHGLIHIGSNSPECDSYQKDEVLLLSDTAAADAIPNLEIQNNSVRCSHGASIGKVKEEDLFYLRSRGISAADSRRLITEGFLTALLPEDLHPRITQKATLGPSSD
jgi:Fe-S cluster assembly protein SufD